MKKCIALLLCLCLLTLGLASCSGKGQNPPAEQNEAGQNELQPGKADEDDNVRIPNPFTDYDSLEAACAGAGIELKLPEAVDGFDTVLYRGASDMLEVIYSDGENEVRVRKATGSDDVTGDYNQYAETETRTVGDLSVNARGENGLVKAASWTADGFAYSITATAGLEPDALDTLVAAIL